MSAEEKRCRKKQIRVAAARTPAVVMISLSVWFFGKIEEKLILRMICIITLKAAQISIRKEQTKESAVEQF